MVMRKHLIAFLFLFFFSATMSNEAVGRAERLTDLLTNHLSRSYDQLVHMAYSESKISTEEFTQINHDLSAATAVCIVDSLVQQAKEQSLDTDKLLADAEDVLINQNVEALSDVLSEEGLGQKLGICVLLAYETVGARFP